MPDIVKALFGRVAEMRALREEALAAGESVPTTDQELRAWLIQRWAERHADN